MTAAAAPDLVQVRLLRYPLDVYQRSVEHFEGLKREFTLLSLSDTDDLPRRLVELIDALTSEYAETVAAADLLREEAIARGETEMPELRYETPRRAVEAVKVLARMLDEADEFCCRGGLLLSLASPAEAVAFRRWYLGEFVAQANGLPPLPWPDADHEALVANPTLRGEPAAP